MNLFLSQDNYRKLADEESTSGTYNAAVCVKVHVIDMSTMNPMYRDSLDNYFSASD